MQRARMLLGQPATVGHTATRTHDHIRHGTLSRMAAQDLDTGKVHYACAQRHRHQEVLTPSCAS